MMKVPRHDDNIILPGNLQQLTNMNPQRQSPKNPLGLIFHVPVVHPLFWLKQTRLSAGIRHHDKFALATEEPQELLPVMRSMV